MLHGQVVIISKMFHFLLISVSEFQERMENTEITSVFPDAESQLDCNSLISKRKVQCQVHPQALDDWTLFFFFFFFFWHFHPFGDPYDMFMQLFYL